MWSTATLAYKVSSSSQLTKDNSLVATSFLAIHISFTNKLLYQSRGEKQPTSSLNYLDNLKVC